MYRLTKHLFTFVCFTAATSAFSCEKLEPITVEIDISPVIVDTETILVRDIHPYNEWIEGDDIVVSSYAPLGLSHQSAAAYGDYAFFVTNGRTKFCMYHLARKEMVYSLDRTPANSNLYHCNQSTFGTELYDPDDPFPLLYVSQNNNSSGRCFIEGYRIKPQKAAGSQEYESFSIELVQTIYLPAMSYDNSLGNANSAIDAENHFLYTYSRNNCSVEANYGICKITKFRLPSARQTVVSFEDDDIIDSFMLDCTAFNMQGGCIKDGILYIGQGIPSKGDLYFNIVDLEKRALVQRFPLKKYNVNWEPEGCFFYDGSVMLAHTSDINRIDKQ